MRFCFAIIGSLLVWSVGTTPVSAQEGRNYGGTIAYAEGEVATTLNPYQRLTARGVTDRLYTLLYDRLVFFDYQNKNLRPALATDWSPRGKNSSSDTLRFTLREGVRWHDGEPLTVEDVKFTYRYIIEAGDDEDARQSLRTNIESVDTNPQTGTITFHLKEPMTSPARKLFSSIWIIPEHKFGESMLPKNKENSLGKSPIGTGPYKFIRQKMDGTIELEAFEEYWGGTPPRKRAFINETSMKVFPDPTTIPFQAIAGNIDLVVDVPTQQITRLENTPKINLQVYPSLSFRAFGYNNDRPILGKRNVRRALTHAVNREALLKNHYNGRGEVIGGPVVPGSALYNPDVEPLEYNPEKARRMLKSAGYTDRDGDGVRESIDGKELSFKLVVHVAEAASSTTRQNVARSYINSLAEVGVEVEAEYQPKQKYTKTVFEKGNFDIAWIQWTFAPGYNFMEIFNGEENVVNYNNKKLDKIFSKYKSAEDRHLRRSLAYDAQKIIAKDVPYTFLYTIDRYTATHQKVINSRIDPYYFFSYYDNWYILPGLRN